MSLGDAIEVETGQFAGEPEELEGAFVIREVQMGESAQNVEAYLSKMVDLLRIPPMAVADLLDEWASELSPGRWVKTPEQLAAEPRRYVPGNVLSKVAGLSAGLSAGTTWRSNCSRNGGTIPRHSRLP